MFKEHFISILAGLDSTFPSYLWDTLLPQDEITVNFLRQSNLYPKKDAWEHFNGLLNYDSTPIRPLGFRLLIHTKTRKQKSWGFRARDGNNIVPSI